MSTKSIVPRANQEGSIGTSSKHWGQIFIDNPNSSGTAAMVLTTRTTAQNALLINGECRDADLIRGVNATFTTGAAFNLSSTYLTADTQSANSVGIVNGFKGSGTSTFKNLFIDSNKTTATAAGKTADIYGIHVDVDDTATNVGAVNSYGIAINNNFASTGGTVNNYGLYTNVDGGDTSYDIYMENSLDSSEFAALRVGNGGELIISTGSDDFTGDITLEADGHVILDAAKNVEINADGGSISFKDDATTLATISAEELDFPLNFTLDVGGDIELNADGGDIVFKDDSTTLATISSQELDFPSDFTLDVGGDIEFNADGGSVVFKDGATTLATLGSNGLDTYIVHLPIQGSISGETSGADGAGAYLVPQTTVNKHNIWGNAAGLVAFDSDLVINNHQSFATHSIMFCNSAGKVRSMDGVMSSNNVGQNIVFELWKGTPPNDQTAAESPVTVVLLATMSDVATGNSESNTMTAATINGTGAYSAGDVLFLTARLATNNTSTTAFFRIGIELLNTPN